MYTRIYGAEEKTVSIPENYDGNAFREEEARELPSVSAEMPDSDSESPEVQCIKPNADDGIFAGLMKKLPLGGWLGNFGIKSLSSFKLGNEEILIAGIALFLFFTKGGDNELAFMLLLLLFVK